MNLLIMNMKITSNFVYELDKIGIKMIISDEKTLIEKYGVEYVNNELKKVSRFYNNSILVK